VVFNDLKQQRSKNVIFDLDAMTRLEGDTGPYVQNAAVRCSGVLRKWSETAGAEKAKPVLTDGALLQKTRDGEEPDAMDTQWQLALQLAQYPSTLTRCARDLETAPLAKYLLDLSRAYHRWYDKVRVINDDDPELTAHRASWCAAVRKVIAAGLGVLGIRTPERM
jgi:arginyl-tRNA synthetase